MRKIDPIFTGLILVLSFLVCLGTAGIPLASSAETPEPLPVSIYSLFETSFPVSLSYQNPFDASDIRVDAEIRRERDEPFLVPCFFDGKEWKLRYTPSQTGSYTFRIHAKTAQRSLEAASGTFQAADGDRRGFIRVSQKNKRHFVFDNGDSYFALGQNLGWVNWNNVPGLIRWTGYLDECAEAGMNWIRIWMCSWGMTELTWTPWNNRYHGYRQYDMVIAQEIDGIFREAEKRGIYIQWVINHHGQYSKQTNPIWNENPFNIANGGFLREPPEFFTSEEAKHHYRNRLRYLVARWGYSTHLMAWEFWNEVNLTSGFDFPTVKEWHEEMSQYLRGIDPYGHLQTTSVSGDYENIYTIQGLDFLQTHAYESNLIGKLASTTIRRVRDYPNIPHFFGEMAYDWRGPTKNDPSGISLHNQLWASVHATSDAGTAMTWWWDNWVRPNRLYPHFRGLADYLDGVDWIGGDPLVPMPVAIEPKVENSGPLIFVPPLGWQNTRRTRFTIRKSGEVEGLDECSQFVHGEGHRSMAPNPIFLMELDRPVEFEFRIEEISENGAKCSVWIDNREVVQRAFAPGEKDSTMGDRGMVTLTVPSGRHNIKIQNTGPDWFKVQYYSVSGLVQRPQAWARGNRERILLWLHDRLHQLAFVSDGLSLDPIQASSLTLPILTEGEYRVEPFDPYTREWGEVLSIQAGTGGLAVPFPTFEKDKAFRIRRVTAGIETPLR